MTTPIPLPCDRCNYLPWDCTCRGNRPRPAKRKTRQQRGPRPPIVRSRR